MAAKSKTAKKRQSGSTFGRQIVDALKPIAGEKIVKKNRYSGFVRTDLEDWLRGQNVRNLLFTGIATNVCVESTARDAYFAEFWPIMIEDAMNNSGPSFNRDATLWNFEHVFGWVTNSANVMAALQQGAQKAA